MHDGGLIGREADALLEAGRPLRSSPPGRVLGLPIEDGRDAAQPRALLAGDPQGPGSQGILAHWPPPDEALLLVHEGFSVEHSSIEVDAGRIDARHISRRGSLGS